MATESLIPALASPVAASSANTNLPLQLNNIKPAKQVSKAQDHPYLTQGFKSHMLDFSVRKLHQPYVPERVKVRNEHQVMVRDQLIISTEKQRRNKVILFIYRLNFIWH